ncbi:MAG: UDP-N-acetylmuramyl-tripeptide synthetase [Spirochaetia bacterium]|jgi:UDP-N-acetylmuramoyl-L-alanyl-D-glutamate--2,6-diaminopimelate ligase|nr:UDP-N-acetylmuramyl-tripeptide synthetase [Spirochaetia bacterium]
MLNIGELFEGTDFSCTEAERSIKGIGHLCYDSRKVHEGDAFFAFPGTHTDGNDFIADAIGKGARLVVTEKKIDKLEKGIVYVTVPHVRQAFAIACANFYGHPADRLSLIGITGTDGKTSTAFFLYQLLKAKGLQVGLVSTVYMDDGTGLADSPYRQSTPEADSLQAFFATCLSNGLKMAIVETTSHALSPELDRLATVCFDLAVITTITSEHLELHKTIEGYIQAKCNLIRKLKPQGMLIASRENPHLDRCMEIAKQTGHNVRIIEDLHCISNPTPRQITVDGTKTACSLFPYFFRTDALLAMETAALLLKCSTKDLLPLLPKLSLPKGRSEVLDNHLKIHIAIDFAHTADAFTKLFSSLRELRPDSPLIIVFGAAGERDKSKRSAMGKAAARYVQMAFVCEEDPRGEDDKAIFNDIISMIDSHDRKKFIRADNRKLAMRQALSVAGEGATVLFLGKGHEHSMEFKDKKLPWDEKAEALRAIKETEKLQLRKKRFHIALFFGGRSPERKVSAESARGILPYIIIQTGVVPYLVQVDEKGNFFLQDSMEENSWHATEKVIAVPGVGLATGPQGKQLEIDAVFDIIHGNEGEDGRLQSFLQLCNIPCCGCDATASALGMAKGLAQAVWQQAGLATIPTLITSRKDPISLEEACKALHTHSIVVKSETTGSSVGVTLLKVPDKATFCKAVELGLSLSPRVLIQPYIDDKDEIECAILEKPDGTLVACGPGLVIDPDKETAGVCTYENKYRQGGVHIICPAPVSQETKAQVRHQALQAFKALGCSGFARVDFFLRSDGTLLINEINTLPGLTSSSHFPVLVESEGISFSSAVGCILEKTLYG